MCGERLKKAKDKCENSFLCDDKMGIIFTAFGVSEVLEYQNLFTQNSLLKTPSTSICAQFEHSSISTFRWLILVSLNINKYWKNLPNLWRAIKEDKR